MQNGSRGPMLRPATPIDWVGDPLDVAAFDAGHGESTFKQFLAHYEEYTDVVGDHFLNLAATTLPSNAYLLTGDEKYRRWVVDYMDAWLARMRENNGIIPSHIALDGTIGGVDRKWWGGAYGWGFQPDQSSHRYARRSQSHWLGACRIRQRPPADRRSEIRRRVAHDDGGGECACARRRRVEAIPDDVRRRWLVRMAQHAVGRWGD
jgi:hypothetical protein